MDALSMDADRVDPNVHLLFWQQRGAGECRIAGLAHRLTVDEALWVPAGVAYAISVGPDSVLCPLGFDVDTRPTEAHEPGIVEVTDEMRRLCLLLAQMRSMFVRSDSNLEYELLRIIEVALADPALTVPGSPAARHAALALRRDPGDRRSAREWAAAGHVSVRTLERSFRDETGLSFREWRARCRMRAARGLLAQGEAPGSVAQLVGYADPSAFGRAFRVETGLTPGAYLRDRAPLGASGLGGGAGPQISPMGSRFSAWNVSSMRP